MSSSFDAAVAACGQLLLGSQVAVVGSREFPELEMVRLFVAQLPTSVVVVSGGARGVDQCAEASARARGLAVRSMPYLGQFKRSGGHIRNKQLVDSLPVGSVLVAFRKLGESPGTDSVVRFARAAAGVQVFVISPTGPDTGPSQLSLF